MSGGGCSTAAPRRSTQPQGFDVTDIGTHDASRTDYPYRGHAVGVAIATGEYERGVIVCGSGVGISIAANAVARLLGSR